MAVWLIHNGAFDTRHADAYANEQATILTAACGPTCCAFARISGLPQAMPGMPHLPGITWHAGQMRHAK
jgi:hypothetical protein